MSNYAIYFTDKSKIKIYIVYFCQITLKNVNNLRRDSSVTLPPFVPAAQTIFV